MPSENVLLGSGIIYAPPSGGHDPVVNKRAPAWRFHADYPEGKVCKTDRELDQADAEGWLDHPGKVRSLPGHEKVWEAQQASERAKAEPPPPQGEVAEPIKTDDQIRADILKAESDKVEAKRLKDEQKTEAKRLAEYEEAKVPVGDHLCTLCGKTFKTEKALNMHGIGAHRNKK